MTGAQLLAEVQGAGLALSIIENEKIKVTGDTALIQQWTAAIREHKPEILTLLAANDHDDDLPNIRAWFHSIGETDPAIIAEFLDKCRSDSDALDYFTRRASEVLQNSDAPAAVVQRCIDCQHFMRPGLSAGYCKGRDDLPPVYGTHHPLRKLPNDYGASCPLWVPC